MAVYDQKECDKKHGMLNWLAALMFVFIGASTTASTWAVKESLAAYTQISAVETTLTAHKEAQEKEVSYLVKTLDQLREDIKAIRQTTDELRRK